LLGLGLPGIVAAAIRSPICSDCAELLYRELPLAVQTEFHIYTVQGSPWISELECNCEIAPARQSSRQPAARSPPACRARRRQAGHGSAEDCTLPVPRLSQAEVLEGARLSPMVENVFCALYVVPHAQDTCLLEKHGVGFRVFTPWRLLFL
jgi:hypothetical protein